MALALKASSMNRSHASRRWLPALLAAGALLLGGCGREPAGTGGHEIAAAKGSTLAWIRARNAHLRTSYGAHRHVLYRQARTLAGRLRRRSEEHMSVLQSLMRTSSAVFCLKTKN